MEIKNFRATKDLNDIYGEIRALGMESNLAELEAFGYTVIEGALSPELTKNLRDTILRVSEQRMGRKLDPENETELKEVNLIPYLIFKDPIFKQAVMCRKQLVLITYLLGKYCVLSSLTCHLKGPGGAGLLLHSDTGNGVPEPFSAYSHVANTNYALTDYTEENGCLAMVPGSHRLHRQPVSGERGLDGAARNPNAVAMEIPAGSAVVWHGNTWHGSFPRKNPGLRINLATYFCRDYMLPQEDYRQRVPAGFLDDSPQDQRLARLLGQDVVHGWKDEGPGQNFYQRRTERGREWQS